MKIVLTGVVLFALAAIGWGDRIQEQIDKAAGNVPEAKTKNVLTAVGNAALNNPPPAPGGSAYNTQVVPPSSPQSVGTAAAGCSGMAAGGCYGMNRSSNACFGRSSGCSGYSRARRGLFGRWRARRAARRMAGCY